jgi:peptide/nickel transport system permease protein
MTNPVVKAIISRIISSVITLFLLISLLFFLVRISPGDPAQKFVSANLSPEIANRVTENFKLNDPLHEQYFSFVINLFKGDLGISYNYRMPVISVVWEFLSFTLVFALMSFLIQLFISYRLAVFGSRKKNKKLEQTISNLSLLFYSTPSFVIGVLLIYVFSVHLDLFPMSGLSSIGSESMNFIERIFDYLYHLILPLITLSIAGVALFYRYLKDYIENVEHQTFIFQLRANGMSEDTILKKHTIPNALGPLISIAGIELGILLGGTLITEVIFSLPGMGRLTIDSILTRDYPLIIGCTFSAGLLMILANFLADILKFKIDKRLLKGHIL